MKLIDEIHKVEEKYGSLSDTPESAMTGIRSIVATFSNDPQPNKRRHLLVEQEWILMSDSDDVLINLSNVVRVENTGGRTIAIWFVDGSYRIVNGTTDSFRKALIHDEIS